MRPLLRLACVVFLALLLSPQSPAVEEPDSPSAKEFARNMDESRKEALRLYPDLANPDSIFARAAKVVENYARREDPRYFEDRWDYPLVVAESTSRKLRAFSPLDPVFSEVVPNFITKKGVNYSEMRVTKIHRDGISIVHKSGTAFIHRDDLTDPQRDEYGTRWSTEVIVPERLINLVNSAMEDRDRDLKLLDLVRGAQHTRMLAEAKFDFDKELCDSYQLGQTLGIRHHRDEFMLRLFELAYVAQESGQREAMERIEKELGEPLPEPYKTRLKELDVKIKANKARYKKIIALLRDKRCELRRDDRPVLKGIPKRGMLDTASFEIVSPDQIRIRRLENNISSYWVFKFDLKKGKAALRPEASKDDEGGEVTFHVLK